MRAISLWQPWATLVAIGAKQYETRHWSTTYRGPLLIHAAKKCNGELFRLAISDPFIGYLTQAGYRRFTELPLGAYVAVVDLVDVLPTEVAINRISDQEYAFGNYNKGRFAWKLENLYRLPEPIPARGHQGFWNPLEGIDPPTAMLIGKLLQERMGATRLPGF